MSTFSVNTGIPYRFDFHHRFVDQRQQNVQVVNSSDHRLRPRSRLRGVKTPQPVHLKKQRPVSIGSTAITADEALDVANLQESVRFS